MKLSIVLLVVLASASIVLAGYKHKKSAKFSRHASKFNLNHLSDDEKEQRFEFFDKIDQMIEKHNSNPNATYKMKHNKFSHMSPEEKKHLNGFIIPNNTQLKGMKGDFATYKWRSLNDVDYSPYMATPGYKLPDKIDYVAAGWNTPARDQRPCGNCWAFAALSALEFAIWKKTKQSVTLSPQDLTDCAKSFNNDGCDGGVHQYAYEYIMKNQINLEANYPFTSGWDGETENTVGSCKANTRKTKYSVKSYAFVNYDDDAALMEVLDKFGAVAVAVDADYMGQYENGIFSTCFGNINHAVTLVGYGTDDGKKYWKIKNSWGDDWGENGYIRITRDVKNACGISSYAVAPIIA